MSVYSSGSKWKNAAQGALSSAQALEEAQKDVEFRRQLLSNIRQERIARAQLEVGNYSDDFISSSAAGATANIDSSLAGESLYAYDTSKRMQQIQDYQQQAKNYMKKYAKQQKTRATAFAITGAAAALVAAPLAAAGLGAAGAAATSAGFSTIGGALTTAGTAIEGASWASIASIGQGIGQIASNTGQSQQGIKNILSGGSQISEQYTSDENMKKLLLAIQDTKEYNRYEAISLDNRGKMIFNTAEQFLLPQPNGTTVKAVRGYFS